MSSEEAGESRLSRRLRTSVMSYGFRQIAVLLLTLGANLILTRFLTPAEFGEVAVILVMINISVLLADGGFGVYLIQRHEEVDSADIAPIASLQLAFSGALALLTFGTAGVLDYFGVASDLPWMLAGVTLSLPFLVVRGMGLLLLERAVRMDQVVRVEVLEETCFAVVAVGTAAAGFGAWSVVFGQLGKALVGCIAGMHIGKFRFRPVRPTWNAELARGIRFGFHYQAAQLINMARVSVNPLFIVPVLGFQAGGFVERSWYFAGASLSIILAVQKKVMFPFISRIQQDVERIRGAVENSIYISAVLDKVMFLPLLLFAEEIVSFVFGDQWLPMVPLIYWLLAGNIFFGALIGPLYPVISGLGHAQVTLQYNFFVLVASWLLIPPFSILMGIEGVGVAGLLLWFSIHWLKKEVAHRIGPFRFYSQIARPTLAFLTAWISFEIIIAALPMPVGSAGALLVFSSLACLFYLLLLFLMDKDKIHRLWNEFRTA